MNNFKRMFSKDNLHLSPTNSRDNTIAVDPHIKTILAFISCHFTRLCFCQSKTQMPGSYSKHGAYIYSFQIVCQHNNFLTLFLSAIFLLPDQQQPFGTFKISQNVLTDSRKLHGQNRQIPITSTLNVKMEVFKNVQLKRENTCEWANSFNIF